MTEDVLPRDGGEPGSDRENVVDVARPRYHPDELAGYVQTLASARSELSHRAIGHAIGVSSSHVNNIIAGRSRPSLSMALKLVEHLDGDVEVAREMWRRDKSRTRLVSTSKTDLIITLLYEIRDTLGRWEENDARDSRG